MGIETVVAVSLFLNSVFTLSLKTFALQRIKVADKRTRDTAQSTVLLTVKVPFFAIAF